MTQLYVLAEQYRHAAQRLADMDIDPQTLADTLESLTGDLETKATNVGMFVRNLEETSAAIKEAENQMANRRKSIEARAAALRRYIFDCMQQAGLQKIESPFLRFSIRNNPPAVDVFDVAQLPADFIVQPVPPPPAPDKVAIKAAITGGRDVPGARLVISQRLDIKA